jgi:LAGLIDADG endonuclease
VIKFSDLNNIIIPHFKSFPLLTRKKVNFIIWTKAVELINSEAHKTKKGFMEILSIYAAIGRGASDKVKLYFPNLFTAVLPEYKIDNEELDPWWISGYLTIYCNFNLSVYSEGWKLDIYNKLRHNFSFSRDISELIIIKLIAEYLEANVFIRTNISHVNIASLENCEYLIKFLDKYPLQSRKHQEYLIWREFVLKAKAFNNSNLKLRGNLDKNISLFLKLIDKIKIVRENF